VLSSDINAKLLNKHKQWGSSSGGVCPMFSDPLTNSRLTPLILTTPPDFAEELTIVSASSTNNSGHLPNVCM